MSSFMQQASSQNNPLIFGSYGQQNNIILHLQVQLYYLKINAAALKVIIVNK